MATCRLTTARPLPAILVMASFVFGPGLTAARAAQSPPAETGHGSIHGTLYETDESTHLAGAKVTAINVRTGRQYTSNPTTDNGDYEVEGLPAGTYDVVIEVAGSLFVADHILDLGPGEGLSKSYSVQPQRPANRAIAKMPPPKGSATVVGESVAPTMFWRTAGGKTLIAVLSAGAAVAIYDATKSKKNEASPSTP